MRWSRALAVALLVAVLPPAVAAQAGPALNTPYEVLHGDLAAAMLSEFLKVRTDFKDPVLVTYEPADTLIDVEIFGNPGYGSKTDKAREVVGAHWDFITAAHIPYMQRRFGVTLSELHYRIIYYDQDVDAAILAFIQGQYVIQ